MNSTKLYLSYRHWSAVFEPLRKEIPTGADVWLPGEFSK